VWCGGFLTDNNTTPTKVVLSCFRLLVGLWQLYMFASSIYAEALMNIVNFYFMFSVQFG
jgi:hypothetical protein